MADKTHNVVSSAVYGALVQTGYISGDLHLYLPSTAPSSGRTLTPSANSRAYYVIGCKIGNRLSLLPLSDDGRTARDELVEALFSIGLPWKVFAPVLTTGRQLVDPPPRDRHDKDVAIRAYTRALDDLQRRVEERANRDELVWFTLGRLLVEIRTYRALDQQFTANSDGSEPQDLSNSLYAAQVMLKGLAEEVQLPSTIGTLLGRFLDALARNASLVELFHRSEQLKQACEAVLRSPPLEPQPPTVDMSTLTSTAPVNAGLVRLFTRLGPPPDDLLSTLSEATRDDGARGSTHE